MPNIIGLDISTSTVGISCWDDQSSTGAKDGKLIELNHISPVIKNFSGAKHEELWEKAEIVTQYISDHYPDVSEIIIETPLTSSKQLDTAALLNYFGGIVFSSLKHLYQTAKFDYITVDQARRHGLPEILGGKKNTLFGDFEKKLDGVDIKDMKKMVVLSLVSQRYPDVVWLLNQNMTIDKKNLDRADSIVVMLGYKQMNKSWTANKKDVQKAKDFVIQNIKYENFIKTLSGPVEQKNKQKYQYLKEIFKIENFINVAI